MKTTMVPLLIILWAGASVAGAIAIGNEPANEGTDKTATVAAAADKAREFKLPPGFYEKQRGKYTLYCKKDAPMGTRIKYERCMSRTQMREYLLVLEQQKTDIDRVRSTCSNLCACGRPEAC